MPGQLYTDSIYVRDGITRWVHSWRLNGWRTADRKPVKNAELWQELIDAPQPHRVEWHWVKGHSGHPENDRADALACAAAAQRQAPRRVRRRIDFGSLGRGQRRRTEPPRRRRRLDAEAALPGKPEESFAFCTHSRRPAAGQARNCGGPPISVRPLDPPVDRAFEPVDRTATSISSGAASQGRSRLVMGADPQLAPLPP